MISIRCIVFDADNTLYQTRSAAKTADMAAMNVLRETTNVSAADLYDEFKRVVDQIKTNPDPKIRHRLYSYSLLSKEHGVEIADKMYAAFSKKLLEEIKPMPGIESLLKNLVERFELWVLTEDNRAMTLNKLTTLRINEYFKNIISSDDTMSMKPSEKYFDTLLQKFKPEEIMVLGDSYEKDLAIPEKLGMRTLLIEKPADLKKIFAAA